MTHTFPDLAFSSPPGRAIYSGVAFLQGLAQLGRRGLAGYEGRLSLPVSDRSKETPGGFTDRRTAAA
jgi:hypothetical protein